MSTVVKAPSLRQALGWGLLIGAASYFFWYGLSTLDPTNVAWLASDDRATAFLGWHFFRFEPWTFPAGLVRNYGEGMNTSLVVTDSVPLVALLLKPFSPLLPADFQFLGPWALASYVANAALGYAIVGRFTESVSARRISGASG